MRVRVPPRAPLTWTVDTICVMTLTGTDRKSFELGEPYGRANNRLYKKIFFSLVQETGRDICYRCGELIQIADDMSIDHKEAWLGKGPDLFWDLENIAFSHRKCNYRLSRREGNRNQVLRKVGPERTSWCAGCKEFLPVQLFANDRTRWHGLQKYCKLCHGGLKQRSLRPTSSNLAEAADSKSVKSGFESQVGHLP